jgi:PD-(D/E)XK nuclease superfamily protein
VDTIRRGNAAEAAVLQALTAAGLQVLLPFGGGLAFDLAALSPEGRILRIQVKTGWVRNGCIEFNSRSTDHGRGQRDYRGRADIIAVHVPSLTRVFIVPVDDCPSSRGYLRLDAPRNKQRRGIRLAEKYSFEAWAESFAAALADGSAEAP